MSLESSSSQFSQSSMEDRSHSWTSSAAQPFLSESEQELDDNPADAYRAISTAAVASLVLGLLSALALLDWWLALIPFAGVIVGFVALRTIRNQPQEYTGRGVAIVGIALAVLFWLGGFGRLTYIHATEVPNGYTRVDYSLLQPRPDDPPNSIPPEAKALDGKKIFIKGYVYPGLRKDGIRQFLLVRDQGTCCFGGNPKITDRIQVAIDDAKGFAFSSSLFKVAGTFRITEPSQAIDARGIVFYHLDGAFLP
jgi:hypothetical protein